MNKPERRIVFSLSLIMAFRLLGLFMVLPVFSLYATKIPHATPVLIGVALGIYGLTQALLQIPLGLLSDRIGRKPIIAAGLVLFGLGSVLAALSHSIYGIILGRALQGAGAIGSTTLALVADLTREEERGKAMAIVGLAIGLSFGAAMIIGPAINAELHLTGIFWITAFFALAGLIVLYKEVPTPSALPPPIGVGAPIKSERDHFKAVFRNAQLLRLDFGIFALHAALTAAFLVIPVILSQRIQLSQYQQAWLYLVVLVLSFLAILPPLIISEKKRRIKPFFLSAIAVLAVCPLLLIFNINTITIGLILFLFFVAFTFLEAVLPSWISKVAPTHHKGAAMGVYSSSQFFGIFVGGSLGGWILGHYHQFGVLIFCALCALFWMALAIPIKSPPAKQIITEDELRKRMREGNLV